MKITHMGMKILFSFLFVSLLYFIFTYHAASAAETNVCTNVKEGTAAFWTADGKLQDSDVYVKNNNLGIGTNAPGGKLHIKGVSKAVTYPNSSTALEIDASGDKRTILQANGQTSAYRIAVQDGFGRVSEYWNAYDAGSVHKYDVDGEGATRITMNGGSYGLFTAPAGKKDAEINWNMGIYQNGAANVGIGTTSPKGKFNVKVRDGDWVIRYLGRPGDSFRKSVVLLHEAHDVDELKKSSGERTKLSENYVNGRIIARRGGTNSWNRKSLVEINTSAAYTDTRGSITTITSEGRKWKLVTVTYNKKKYLAVELPYSAAPFKHGLVFEGYYRSTAPDALKLVDYYQNNNDGYKQRTRIFRDKILNADIKNSIKDFGSVGQEYKDVSRFVVSGNVGIGTVSPKQKLEVNGQALARKWNTSSDKRWKKNIQDLTDSLNKIMKIRGVSYNWNTEKYPDMGFDEKTQIGFIAQELEKVLPELVTTDSEGYKSVDYQKMTAILAEGMQEQQEQIDTIKKENEKLQKDVQELKTQIADIYKKLEN